MSHFMRTIESLARAVGAAFVALLFAIPSHGGGGVTGTGHVAQGSLTAFGSVFVNGIEFFTEGASVIIDGIPGRSETELRAGMQLRVVGVVGPDGRTGTASSVEYEADLRGTIDGPATVLGEDATFRVHGIAVRTDERTVFEYAHGAASLAAGDRVEVSGFRDAATGELLATFVSRGATAPATIVSGVASEVGGGFFTIGSIRVDYSTGTLRDFPAGGLASGMVVRVIAGSPPMGGTLVASEVRLESGSLGAAGGTEASVEGVVSLSTGAGFSLGGLVIRVDGETRYRNGTAADLADGEVVEAEGFVLADDSILASRVTFRAPDAAGAKAVVVAKDAAGFWLVSADGLRIEVSNATRFRDKSRARADNFSLATLAVGDTVSVDGQEIDVSTILASSVSRTDFDPVVHLKARARQVASPTAIALGLRANATDATSFSDADGTAIGSQAFFAKAAGRRLAIRGFAEGTDSVRAFSMEIEK